jgi:hypothetical protein
VCLPNAETNALPSAAFVDAVNQAASTKKAYGTTCTLTIIDHEPVLAMYARIILRSYGIGKQDVEIATSLNSVAVRDSEKLTRIGSCDNARSGLNQHTEEPSSVPQTFQTAMIVLGNRPLDDCTPTVDMVQRVLAAISYAKAVPQPVLVLTGGPTVGTISEAKMMALVALSRGFPRNQLVLEERSRTTYQNAAFTAPIVEHMQIKQVFLVSKKSHLEFALPEFRKHSVFKDVQPLESPEVYAQSIQEMVDYLKAYDDHEVRTRLEALRRNSHGMD